MPRKTLDDIRAIPKETLTPKDVAGYLGCNPYSITLQARENPKALLFPTIVVGTRTIIPKEGFVRCCAGLPEESA